MKTFAGLPNKSSAIRKNLHRNRTGQTRASTMKTLLTTCLCSLAFALLSLAQAPPPAQAPPAAAATSPAPAVAATPEQPAGILGSNWLIDKFHKGGPVMWPILIVSIVALTVVLERCIWWGGRWFRRDPKRIEKVFTAIENG